MIKVYTASKLVHAPLWRILVEDWPGVEFVARWPFNEFPDEATFARVFWEHDLEDVGRCDVVLVYAAYDDKLRGALVEAGMALALGKQVIVVGDHRDYGTWRHHPRVHGVADLEQARLLLSCMAL
jgi:nucleoside 2-deoxyribosyltransferase